MVPPDDDFDDFDEGWDTRASLVDGRWVDRTPRWPDREPQLRREAALLPWLAPQLPLPVPEPVILAEVPLTVRHAYLPGGPCPGTSGAHGAAIGGFLAALHAVDPEAAVGHGAQPAAVTPAGFVVTLARMEREVLPLLPDHVVARGDALLRRLSEPATRAAVIHGDLGPAHIRVVGERVGGVIDWGDSCVGDPALDLAWTTFGAGTAFSGAVVAAYRPDSKTRRRARDWYLLGPWHEVLHGLGAGGRGFVESGLAGTVERLERWGDS